MWIYVFDVDQQKARRNTSNQGYLPIAMREPLKPNGKSTVSIKVNVKNGFARVGVVSKKAMENNAWTRDNFIFLDGNSMELGKNSCIMYNRKQMSENLEFVGAGDRIIKMEVDMGSRKVSWFLD